MAKRLGLLCMLLLATPLAAQPSTDQWTAYETHTASAAWLGADPRTQFVSLAEAVRTAPLPEVVALATQEQANLDGLTAVSTWPDRSDGPDVALAALASMFDDPLVEAEAAPFKEAISMYPSFADALTTWLDAVRHHIAAGDALDFDDATSIEAALGMRVELADATHALATASSLIPCDALDYELDEGWIRISLGPGSHQWSRPYNVGLDRCGDDDYQGLGKGANAGGTRIVQQGNGKEGPRVWISAAHADLAGHDDYGSPEKPLGNGLAHATGGGRYGSGFLYDAAGDDEYHTRTGAASGGARLGIGTLIDGGGDDQYHAHQGGVNGGAHGEFTSAPEGIDKPTVFAYGFLYDASGHDAYYGASRGANGGGAYRGAGMLIDGGGDDVYDASADDISNLTRLQDQGANGGGYLLGTGVLIDLAGSDFYVGQNAGNNGGGYNRGTGALVDLGQGHDRFHAGNQGTNGGAYGLIDLDRSTLSGPRPKWLPAAVPDEIPAAGVPLFPVEVPRPLENEIKPSRGLLFDELGDAELIAGDLGTNGGGWDFSHGFVVAGPLTTTYQAGSNGTNGGGGIHASGAIIDTGGDDLYEAGSHGANGGAIQNAYGMILDLGGNDHYTAHDGGTNGGSLAVSISALIDMAGNDNYTAGQTATNGGSFGEDDCQGNPFVSHCVLSTRTGGSGLLFDALGQDHYYTLECMDANGWDRSAAKGTVGWQIDAPQATTIETSCMA